MPALPGVRYRFDWAKNAWVAPARPDLPSAGNVPTGSTLTTSPTRTTSPTLTPQG